MIAHRRSGALLAVGLIAAASPFVLAAAPAQAAPEDYGLDSVSASLSTQQAGAHPDFTTSFLVKQDPSSTPNVFGLQDSYAATKDISIALPPGLSGNPSVVPHCTEVELDTSLNGGGCPNASQVGTTTIYAYLLNLAYHEPVYMMEPPGGDVVARLGFLAADLTTFIDLHLRTDPAGRYRLVAEVDNASSQQDLIASDTTIWGVPADPAHDTERMTPAEAFDGHSSSVPRPPGGPELAFMTNPTHCGTGDQVTFSANSWARPDLVSTMSAELPAFTGCESLHFRPQLSLQPTTSSADSSSGMHVDLSLPQGAIADPNSLVEANLRKAVVTLPAGISLNPSAADGLGGCTEAEIGLTSSSPINFDDAPPSCPNSSVVGTALITTPLLPDPIPGTLYLAAQNDNPFHTLLSGYLVAQGEGVLLKIPGRFDTDPQTGRITATFDGNPEQPFSDLELDFKGGSRGVLVTPPTCGIYQISSTLTPWSGTPPVDQTGSFTVDHSPTGGACEAGDPSQPGDPADRAARPFSPQLSAGTVTPLAGAYSPFVLRLTRRDGEQELTRLSADLPPGVLGKLAGIPECSDAAINSIPTGLGTGAGERATPSCPAASRVGYTEVGAGAGTQLTYIPGNVYLAGPYKGAPLSLAIVTPALAGPFDLGNVVIRTALYIDQDDAQLHALSDPLPTILQGIPLHLRDIRVVMDRPDFTLNPTNCNPMQVTGSADGAGADLSGSADDISAPISDRFQVGGCGALGFSPSLSGQILNGAQGIHRSDHPNLQFNLHGTPGDANLASVSVLLPQSFQIDQANLGNICSETELATNECAGRNTVGTATATTPLLDTPLSGPVYAVSGSGGLPKLAVILHGPPSMPIKLVVRGVTSTVGARIQNTFPLVPDAPVTDFALTLNGGAGGYLVNNTDVCGKAKGKSPKARKKASKLRRTNLTANASFTAQDGDTLSQSVPISAQCPKAKKKKSRHARRGKR